MFDIESIASDKQKEEEGVWCPLPGGARAKVARTGNDEYNKVLRRKFKGNRAILEQEDDLAAKVSEDVMIEVFAFTILKDIEGIAMNGKPIEKYTPQIGMLLLKNRNFREKIKAYAEQTEMFLIKQEEEAVNS